MLPGRAMRVRASIGIALYLPEDPADVDAWLARADTLPLVFTVLGAQGLPRGTQVRVKLGAIDDIALDVGGTVLEVLDADAPADTAPDDEDETSAAGPIAIAVDVNEAEGEKEGSRADNPAP